MEFRLDNGVDREVIPIDTTDETISSINLPSALDPTVNREQDLQYDTASLLELGTAGFNRVGAGVLAYDRDDNTGGLDFLVVLQQPSAKNPKPVWSMPSETSQYGFDEHGNLHVETALQTAVRCLVEELDITYAPIVHTKVFPWLPTQWPIGSVAGETRRILAPVVPIGLPFTLHGAVDSFRPNEELQAVKAVPIEGLLRLQEEGARRGYVGALGQMMLAGTIAGIKRGSGPFLADSNLAPVTEGTTPEQRDSLVDVTSIDAVMHAREVSGVVKWQDLILPDLLESLRDRTMTDNTPPKTGPAP